MDTPPHQGRRNLLHLALLGGMSRVLPAAASATPAPAARLDAELDAIAADPACELPSYAAIAMRGGKIVYERHQGRRTVDGAPVTARTMYRIASISKMMTTLGLMRLVEQNKLALDTDVSDYLGFTLRNPHFPERAVTLRSLLTHTSSLRDDAGYYWGAERALKDILVPGSRYYGKGEMWASHAPLGDYFTYANLGWGVIGTIMERASGERFDRLMKRLLLDPLGLNGGYLPYEFSAEDLANTATLFRKAPSEEGPWNPQGPWIPQTDDFSKQPPKAPPGLDSYVVGSNATIFSPTGGLRLCATDMARIMQMLIQRGSLDGKQILKPETLARMFTRQWTFNGSNGDTDKGRFFAWGMGNQQFVDQPASGRPVVPGLSGAVGHLGFAWGLYSVFMVDLEKGDGLILLAGGTGTDPEPSRAQHVSITAFQARMLSAMTQSYSWLTNKH